MKNATWLKPSAGTEIVGKSQRGTREWAYKVINSSTGSAHHRVLGDLYAR